MGDNHEKPQKRKCKKRLAMLCNNLPALFGGYLLLHTKLIIKRINLQIFLHLIYIIRLTHYSLVANVASCMSKTEQPILLRIWAAACIIF
jgi:hypothetical protein